MRLNNLFTDTGTVGTVFQYGVSIILLLCVFLSSMSVYRGWGTWIISAPSLLFIITTAIARVYDISARSKRWFIRRMGFILVACSAVASLIAPLLGYTASFPSWKGVVFTYGICLVWLTTPGQPPWWAYINGDKKISSQEDTYDR